MHIPAWVKRILDRFDADITPHSEVEIAEELGNAFANEGPIAEEDRMGFMAERSVFFLREIVQGTSIWGTYFGPMVELMQGDKRVYIPDISDLETGVIEHWGQRSLDAKNPMMKARYADAAWDLAQAVAQMRPNHEHARTAIDSYLPAVERTLYHSEIVATHWLGRALDHAKSLNDKNRVEKTVNAIFAFHRRSFQPRHVGVWVFLFDTLYGQKSLISEAQEKQIVDDLEAILARITVMKEVGSEFDPFGAQAAAERLAEHYKRKGDRNNAKRVVKAYGEAFHLLAEKASPMLAIAWMQPVIERFEQEGMRTEAETLRLFALSKGENIAADMKEYSVEVNIPKEEFEKVASALVVKEDLAKSLASIGQYFIPSTDRTRKMLDEQARVAPILSSTSLIFVDRTGRFIAKAGPVDEEPEGRLFQQLIQVVDFYRPLLSYVLDALMEQLKPSVDQILDVLYQSPLFQNDRRAILQAGLSAYASGDFLKSIHVLVFQIEEMLRTLLVLKGIPPHKSVPRHPGISDVKNMNDVLDDERVREALTENVWRYLKALYVERRGLNLRNDLAHGLLPVEGFNQAIANQVFHSVLVLSLVRKR